MQFTPRPYQTEAINAAVEFFSSGTKEHAFEILPTGSGKSVVIANVAKELDGKILILQPSKEILEQNVQKFMSYGFRAGIYSASAGQKRLDKVTFATIGSVYKKPYLFQDFYKAIVDECHLVNPADGMYQSFFGSNPNMNVLGLTATPYRLSAGSEGAELQFINRTNPRLFSKLIYYIQNNVLFDAGHLAKLEYFSFDVVDRSKLQMNASGTDFTESSLMNYYRQINMPMIIIRYANSLLKKRKNLLIFCSLIAEALDVQKGIPGAIVLTGQTKDETRAKILIQFKAGIITCLINVGVLTTGFDYPELECVLMARSTMSLALYYQIIGRAMRPHPEKESSWFVDLGGNINLFGKIETMRIQTTAKGLHYITNNGKQLTNIPFTKN